MICKQYALLIALLMHPVCQAANSNTTSPIAALMGLAGGVVVATAGYASTESLKGMVEDIKSGKENTPDLETDLCNIVKTAAIVPGLIALGNFVQRKDVSLNVAPTFGSIGIASGIYLAIKHGCKNKDIRLREIMGVLILGGFARKVLAPLGLALQF